MAEKLKMRKEKNIGPTIANQVMKVESREKSLRETKWNESFEYSKVQNAARNEIILQRTFRRRKERPKVEEREER